MNSFSLGFGALQKPLVEQLQDQGIAIAPEKMELCQKLAKGITLAYVHGILTESEVNKARQRLMKKVRTVLERDAAQQSEESDGAAYARMSAKAASPELSEVARGVADAVGREVP